MRRRRAGDGVGGMSLVPMADMLTNTVGIMLFILAFTILASAGAVVARGVPMERHSGAAPILFVCANQRVRPLNLELDLARRFAQSLGKPTRSTLEEWLHRFNTVTIEDENYIVGGRGRASYTVEGIRLKLTAWYAPKPSGGEGLSELRKENSKFASILRAGRGSRGFAYFIVYPDCIDVFREARAVALEVHGVTSGWNPLGTGEPVRFNMMDRDDDETIPVVPQ